MINTWTSTPFSFYERKTSNARRVLSGMIFSTSCQQPAYRSKFHLFHPVIDALSLFPARPAFHPQAHESLI
jgi:hypothetical protein